MMGDRSKGKRGKGLRPDLPKKKKKKNKKLRRDMTKKSPKQPTGDVHGRTARDA